MPTENDKTGTAAPTEAQKELEKKLEAAAEKQTTGKSELKDLKAENASLKKQVEELQAKLATPAEAGSDDDNYAVIKGKRYKVEGVVTAKFATDEARKGHLHGGLETELAVLR